METGITGWPLDRTLSPVIHAELFRLSGIEGYYREYPTEPTRLPVLLSRLHGASLRGLNVTFPHKMDVIRHCTKLDGEAEAVSAVNTLMSVDEGWMGYNTDVAGFRHVLRSIAPPDPVCVIGSGGAAMAVARALAGETRDFSIFCRSPETWSGEGLAYPLVDLEECMKISSGTLVNATVLGWEDDDDFPVYWNIPGGFLFMDLNYNPNWAWRNSLRARGIRVVTGEHMLVRQAAESFRIWTGFEADEEALAAITDVLLSREEQT